MRRPRLPKQPPIDLERVLPPPGPVRWSAWKKAAVVMAVRSGSLPLREAYGRYMLSQEEYSRWEKAFDHDGIAGLQAKNLATGATNGNP